MNQNRRAFLGTLGLFSILPGAGRVWKAIRQEPEYRCIMLPPGPKHVLYSETVVIEYLAPSPEWVRAMNDAVLGPGPRIRPSLAENQAFVEAFFYGKPIKLA